MLRESTELTGLATHLIILSALRLGDICSRVLWSQMGDDQVQEPSRTSGVFDVSWLLHFVPISNLIERRSFQDTYPTVSQQTMGFVDGAPTGSECLWKSTALLSESGNTFNQHNFWTLCCFMAAPSNPNHLG